MLAKHAGRGTGDGKGPLVGVETLRFGLRLFVAANVMEDLVLIELPVAVKVGVLNHHRHCNESLSKLSKETSYFFLTHILDNTQPLPSRDWSQPGPSWVSCPRCSGPKGSIRVGKRVRWS